MYCYRNEPVELLPTRMRTKPSLAWSAGSQGLDQGECVDPWRRAAGRDAESMLRSIAMREAEPFGLADLPALAR